MMAPAYAARGVTLYHGDAVETMRQLPAESVDLVMTSPPYNAMNTAGHGFFWDRGRWPSPALADGYADHADNMPHADYIEWQKTVLAECWRLLRPDGAIFYNHKPRIQAGEVILPTELNPGLPLRQIVIWRRAGGINANVRHYCPTHEWILIFAKPAWRLRDQAASMVGDVWEIAQETGNPHPAPFPVALPLRALETTGAAVVLDPFAGSGSTLVAARQLGRQAVGIELSRAYIDMAIARLEPDEPLFAHARQGGLAL